MNILIVDDNPINRKINEKYCDTLKHDYVSAKDGIYAIEEYKKNDNFDIVLSDIQMPRMDGVETLKELRKLNPDLIIIAITANNMKGDKERYLSEGFDYYLPKPLIYEDLVEILENPKINH